MARPLIRLYCDVPTLAAGQSCALPGPAAHYLGTVMRCKAGDQIEIFNGRDGAWIATLTTVARAAVLAQVETLVRSQEVPADIWLCAAPLKKDRIDWLAEKACELGAARLMPVLTARTIVTRLNTGRLIAHMIEAAEQCGRTSVPVVGEPATLAALLRDWPPLRTLLFCDEAGGAPLPDLLANAAPCHAWGILVGPEGGFDDAERAAIRAHPSARAITLGPRILRADTAAVAALCVLQALTGGWQS